MDPRDSLDFTVHEKLGNLIFVNMIGKGILLNRDGKTPTESDDKATLIINKFFNNLKTEDQKTFCIARLEKLPYNYKLINDREILFKENGGYYIFVGTFMELSKNGLNDIKKVINSFSTF